MSRRNLLFIAVALGLLAVGKLASMSRAPAPSGETAFELPVPSAPPPFPVPSDRPAAPLRRPGSSIAEYGVLTDRPKAELDAQVDRASLAAAIPARLCGDEAACEAVRATLRDERATSLDVLAATDWSLARLDVERAGPTLTAAERAAVKTRPRVVVVHVSSPTSPRQLALRAAIAAAAFVADEARGVVWDQLLDRLERARDFAAHAVTEPLGAPTFRRDRVQLFYEPKEEGVVRVLTGGLSRWGLPDVELARAPAPASERLGDVVLGVAAALADGAPPGPLSLSRAQLARARGEAYPVDAGLPPDAPVEIDVDSVPPEPGDPNDFMARVEPEAGDTPLATMALAERWFGPLLAAAPGANVMAGRQARAQQGLASSIARWEAGKARGAQLLVLVPFAIPGGGSESMWLEVTRADAGHVTGRVMDAPLAATEVHKGDVVTRARAEVEDVDLRTPRDN